MIAEGGLETKEEKGLHFKKEFGPNLYLRNKPFEN